MLSSMRDCAVTLASELTSEELSSLLGIVKASHLKGRYLEIGTGAGGTLRSLMQCFEDNARPPL